MEHNISWGIVPTSLVVFRSERGFSGFSVSPLPVQGIKGTGDTWLAIGRAAKRLSEGSNTSRGMSVCSDISVRSS